MQESSNSSTGATGASQRRQRNDPRQERREMSRTEEHLSTAYDSHIFQDTEHLHPRFQNEMSIGDVHFRNCRNFATPPVKPPGGHLTTAGLVFLQYIQLFRSRIETHNTVFKRHGILKKGTIFRGHVVNLAAFVKITAHGTAVELRQRERNGNQRHQGYGWWSHF